MTLAPEREPLEIELRRETLTELDAAQREHSDLFRRWRGLDARADEIRRERLSDLDETLALAELKREREDLAPRLKEAILRLQRARVVAANDKLGPLVAQHRKAATKAERRRKRAERALCELMASLILAGESFAEETALARAVLKAAEPAVPVQDEKERLRRDARHQVPARFDGDGAIEEWADRPSVSFFEGSRELTDATAYQGLERLARLGRRKALNHLGGTWRSEVAKALDRIEGRRS